MSEQQTPDFANAKVLNIDVDGAKIASMVKELALFVNGKDMSTIEVMFALDELAGRIIVEGCGGNPLIAAKLKQSVQQHLDNVVRIGFQAKFGGASNDSKIIVTH